MEDLKSCYQKSFYEKYLFFKAGKLSRSIFLDLEKGSNLFSVDKDIPKYVLSVEIKKNFLKKSRFSICYFNDRIVYTVDFRKIYEIYNSPRPGFYLRLGLLLTRKSIWEYHDFFIMSEKFIGGK